MLKFVAGDRVTWSEEALGCNGIPSITRIYLGAGPFEVIDVGDVLLLGGVFPLVGIVGRCFHARWLAKLPEADQV